MLPVESKKPRSSPRSFRRPDISSPLGINHRPHQLESQAGSSIFPDMAPQKMFQVVKSLGFYGCTRSGNWGAGVGCESESFPEPRSRIPNGEDSVFGYTPNRVRRDSAFAVLDQMRRTKLEIAV
jgi:hypothetical protein